MNCNYQFNSLFKQIKNLSQDIKPKINQYNNQILTRFSNNKRVIQIIVK